MRKPYEGIIIGKDGQRKVLGGIMLKKLSKLLDPYRGLPKEVYILFASRLLNALGAFVWPMLTLLLTKKLGYSSSYAGFLISIASIPYSMAGLLGGKMTDKFGRKRMIVIFDALGALLLMSCALMPLSLNTYVLIVLSGMSFNMSDVAHSALIADVTTPENRDGAYSLTYMGFNIGFAMGPAIGGMLFENHLKLFFIGDGLTTLLSVTIIALFVGESIHKVDEDLGEDRALERKVDGTIFRVLFERPMLLIFALVVLGYNFTYAQWSFLLPMQMESVFVDRGAALYGQIASFNGIVVMLFTPLITSLFTKFKPLLRIVIGGVTYIVGFGMFGYIDTLSMFFLGTFIFTIGEIIITISTSPFIANHTPASHRGRMNAILPLIMGVGFMVGPVLMGEVVKQRSIAEGWHLIAFIMLVSSIAMLGLYIFDEKNTSSKAALAAQNGEMEE